MRTSIARSMFMLLAAGTLAGVVPITGAASATTATPGATLWAARFNGPGAGSDSGLTVAMSPDGTRAYVGGYSSNPDTFRDYVTIAYDVATGALLWEHQYASSQSTAADQVNAIVVDPSRSTVFVTGQSVTIAYDAASGVQRWVRPFTGSTPWPGDAGTAAAVRGGTLFVTGITLNGMRTIAYDAATGDVVWLQQYSAKGYPYLPSALALSPDGTVVAVTAHFPGESPDYLTFAYDSATGRQVWFRTFGRAQVTDFPGSLGVTDQLVVVTGESTDASGLDLATIAYDLQTGATRWVRRYDGPFHGTETMPSLSLSPDQSTAYVIGRSRSADGFDYETIAYDTADGSTSWRTRLYVGDAYYAPSLEASPDGTRVIVAGTTADEYLTVAFGANDGTRLWARRFGRWGQKLSRDVAISPDGATVVVTGTSSEDLDFEPSDIATVAYRAS